MNEIKNTKNPQEPPVRVRNSIARKLGSRMVLRLFGIFISLDIALGLITGGCLAAYSEQKAAELAGLLTAASASTALPDDAPPSDTFGKAGTSEVGAAPETTAPRSASAGDTAAGPDRPGSGIPGMSEDLLGLTGVGFAQVTGPTPGITIPMPFSNLLPEGTRTAKRDIEATAGTGAPLRDRLENIVYVVYYSAGATDYKLTVSLKPFLRIIDIAALVLVIYELLSIFGRSRKDRRMVRRMLDPITELTRAAQDLNAVTRQLDPEKMAALAGKLEGINAARLDTRIQVDDTQAELKNLARAINGMLDRINESYRAQVRFVSDASHELRTPISVIQGYANLLDRWGKNDEKTLQESITAIKEEAAGMKELVEQLLFLARGDNNTIMLQPEAFNLAELAREVASEARMIDPAHEYGTELSNVTVSADRALIKQALRILVDNAVKYTDPDGKITLLTESDGTLARLGVRDNGIGISPENVPRIFDRFYRADESRARATGGAGLGLSIANWITSRHGGHMEVLSREGLGTKITIVLPGGGTALASPGQPG